MLFAAINNPGQGLGHAAAAALKIPFSSAPRTGKGEWTYLLFPLPDLCRAAAQLPIPDRFEIDSFQRILIELPAPQSGGIVYNLDQNFKVVEYRLSDNVAFVHDRFFREGLLDHPFSPREAAELGRPRSFLAAPDGNAPDLFR